MHTGFGAQAVLLLDAAHCEAKRDRRLTITIFNVLTVLLKDKDLKGSFLRMGVDCKRASQEVLQFKQHNPESSSAGTEFSAGMKKALEAALKRAEQEGRVAGPLDVLYGVLSECNQDGLLFEILGIAPDKDIECIYTSPARR